MQFLISAAICMSPQVTGSAQASLIVQTSAGAQVGGSAVESEAIFGEVGTTGVWDGSIVLANLIATPEKAQILTGLLFTINGSNPALSLLTAGLETGAVLVLNRSGTTSSAPINLIGNTITNQGRYQFEQTPGGVIGSGGYAAEYGVSTIGGGVFQGNIVGNDDYGIIGPGTQIGNQDFKATFPYVSNAVRFQFGGLPAGGIDLSQITGVKFTYGSEPNGFILGSSVSPAVVPTPPVPEPSTLALLSTMPPLGLAIWLLKRRRSAS